MTRSFRAFRSFRSSHTAHSLDRGLLLLRVALGIVFVAHGWQKLAVFGLGGVTGMLGSLGIPFPGLNAGLLIAAELLGGVALLAGAATRFTALVIAFDMAVAIATVHISRGFFLPEGFEFALTLLLASVAVAFTGAGRYSIDARVSRPTATQATLPEPARANLTTAA